MRHFLIPALTLSLALVPATAAAQQPGAAHGTAHRGLAANPAARVLALPTVLELTAAQVTRLEQIRDRTTAQNQPLLQQLEAARPERAGRGRGELRGQPEQRRAELEQRRAELQERRAELQARREQLKPVVEQLRANAATARREVESVLTSEQLAKLRELEGARQHGGRHGPRPQR